jgi:hypothetical protein
MVELDEAHHPPHAATECQDMRHAMVELDEAALQHRVRFGDGADWEDGDSGGDDGDDDDGDDGDDDDDDGDDDDDKQAKDGTLAAAVRAAETELAAGGRAVETARPCIVKAVSANAIATILDAIHVYASPDARLMIPTTPFLFVSYFMLKLLSVITKQP